MEGTTQQIELSLFTGNLRRDDRDMSRDCWRISDGNNFRVRSKNFLFDKSKVILSSFFGCCIYPLASNLGMQYYFDDDSRSRLWIVYTL